MREQNVIEILSSAQMSGVDAATAAIDRENAALSRLYSAAAGGATAAGNAASSQQAMAGAFVATTSAANTLGASLDELNASGNVRVVATADTTQAQSAIAQTKAGVSDLRSSSAAIPITASNEQASAAIAMTKAGVADLRTSSAAIPITASNDQASAAIAMTKAGVADLRSSSAAIPITATNDQAMQAIAGTKAAISDLGQHGGSILANLGSVAQTAYGGLGSVNNRLLNFASSVSPATAGVIGLGIAFGGTAVMGLKAAGEMERYEVQLSVLMGSSDKAKERLAELVDFAATTPFEIPEVVRASKVLQVFGGDALATGDNLRLVGDVSAGTGKSFEEMAMIVGQVKSSLAQGLVPSEKLMQLSAVGALSGEASMKIKGMAEAVRDGRMTADEAFEGFMGSFAQFSGMMVAQSATFEGKMSNAMDAVGGVFREIGALLLPVAKTVLDAFIGLANGLAGVFAFIGENIRPLGAAFGVAAAIIATTLVPAFLLWTAVAIPAAIATTMAAAPLIALGLAVVGVAFALEKLGILGPIMDAFGTAVGFVGQVVSQVFNDVIANVKGAVNAIMDGVWQVVNAMAQIPGPTQEAAMSVRTSLEQMKVDFNAVPPVVNAGANSMVDGFDSMAGGAVGAVDKTKGAVGTLPGAVGGVVPGTKGAADELGKAISEPIRTATEDALAATKTGMAGILESITGTRSILAGGAQAAADAIHDPAILKLQIEQTKQEMAAQQTIIRDKDSTAAQVLSAKIRALELEKQLGVQLTNQTTYGDATQKKAAIQAEITRIKSTAEWKTGTTEQKTALQQQVANLTAESAKMVTQAEVKGADIRDGFMGPINKMPGETKTAGEATRSGYMIPINKMPGQAGTAVASIKGKLVSLGSVPAYTWGYNTGSAYADGLRATVGLVQDAAYYVAEGANILGASSPPGPKSPLHLIDVWGERTIEAYADGMRGAAGAVKRAAVDIAGGAAGALSGASVARSAAAMNRLNAVQEAAWARPQEPAYAAGSPRAAWARAGQSITIGEIVVNLPVGWKGSSSETRSMAERLADEMRMTATGSRMPLAGNMAA